MTDEVAAALREAEKACPCALIDYPYCPNCLKVAQFEEPRCPEADCLWPGHAAITKYGDARERAGADPTLHFHPKCQEIRIEAEEAARKAGREEATRTANCPFDHAVLAANAVALCVNCGLSLAARKEVAP